MLSIPPVRRVIVQPLLDAVPLGAARIRSGNDVLVLDRISIHRNVSLLDQQHILSRHSFGGSATSSANSISDPLSRKGLGQCGSYGNACILLGRSESPVVYYSLGNLHICIILAGYRCVPRLTANHTSYIARLSAQAKPQRTRRTFFLHRSSSKVMMDGAIRCCFCYFYQQASHKLDCGVAICHARFPLAADFTVSLDYYRPCQWNITEFSRKDFELNVDVFEHLKTSFQLWQSTIMLLHNASSLALPLKLGI